MSIIVITGAAGHLGTAVMEKFLSLGARVIATYDPNGQKVTQTHSLLEAYPVDLTDEEEVNEFIGGVVARHGRIDAAIMLAGGIITGRFTETKADKLDQMFKTNFETAYFVARPVFEQMCEQEEGGKMFFIGGRGALDSNIGKNMLAYSLSKSLLNKLSEFINLEGKKKNISSTVIVPSIIDTPTNRSAMPDADFDLWVKPERIADVISFLCTDSASDLRENILKMFGNA